MLTKSIIILLRIHDGARPDKFNQYDLARLRLSGLLDEDNQLTPDGDVIVAEILNMVERVL